MIISPTLCQMLEKWQTIVTIEGQQRPQQKGKIRTHRPLLENLLAMMIRILPPHPTQTILTIPTIHHLLMIAVVVAVIVDLVIVEEEAVIR